MAKKETPATPAPAPKYTMPQEWEMDAYAAAPTSVVKAIANDFRRGPSAPSSLAGSKGVNEMDYPRASGGTAPIEQPPGLRWIDRQLDEADRQERIARLQMELDNAEIEARLAGYKSNVRSEYHPMQRFDHEMRGPHRDEDDTSTQGQG